MKKIFKWGIGIFFCFSLIISSYLGFSLKNEKNSLLVKYDTLNQKNELLLQKVKEENSKVKAYMGKQRAAEAIQAKLNNEISDWKKVVAELHQDINLLKKQINSQSNTWEQKKDVLLHQYENLKKKQEQCEGNYKAALLTIEEKKQTIHENQQQIASLEAKLKRTNIKLTRCEGKNSELCDVSISLLDKFENQGVFDSILKRENFVQLNRVKVEKLVQDYQDKIEDLNIENTSGNL